MYLNLGLKKYITSFVLSGKNKTSLNKIIVTNTFEPPSVTKIFYYNIGIWHQVVGESSESVPGMGRERDFFFSEVKKDVGGGDAKQDAFNIHHTRVTHLVRKIERIILGARYGNISSIFRFVNRTDLPEIKGLPPNLVPAHSTDKTITIPLVREY
jgi:hypothetical protein